jgi:flagellar assembly protein FliH
MLSRILRDDEQGAAQPLPWKRAGGGPPPPPKPVAPVPVVMHRTEGGHFQPESALQDQINALKRQIAELEAAAERRVREAREAGLREGEAAGRNQATAQIQPVLDKMAQSIREIGELRPKLRHQAEMDVVKLATAIAKKILHRELSADPESLTALIRFAMEKIRLHELLRVRVHPQHHPAVQQAVAQIAMGAQVDVISDPKLPLGGVLIETTRGEFDASVDTQLREIERGLADRLAHGASR